MYDRRHFRNEARLVVALLLAACGSSPSRTTDHGVDDLRALDLSTQPDLAEAPDMTSEPVPDLAAAADFARRGDLASQGCQSDKDCRLYSNQCKTPKPCICIPLRATDPDPICMGPMVDCFVDPCMGKTAACDPMTGNCIAK